VCDRSRAVLDKSRTVLDKSKAMRVKSRAVSGMAQHFKSRALHVWSREVCGRTLHLGCLVFQFASILAAIVTRNNAINIFSVLRMLFMV
jgi:hypothetical protein